MESVVVGPLARSCRFVRRAATLADPRRPARASAPPGVVLADAFQTSSGSLRCLEMGRRRSSPPAVGPRGCPVELAMPFGRTCRSALAAVDAVGGSVGLVLKPGLLTGVRAEVVEMPSGCDFASSLGRRRTRAVRQGRGCSESRKLTSRSAASAEALWEVRAEGCTGERRTYDVQASPCHSKAGRPYVARPPRPWRGSPTLQPGPR